MKNLQPLSGLFFEEHLRFLYSMTIQDFEQMWEKRSLLSHEDLNECFLKPSKVSGDLLKQPPRHNQPGNNDTRANLGGVNT